jgi:hypothetical protein
MSAQDLKYFMQMTGGNYAYLTNLDVSPGIKATWHEANQMKYAQSETSKFFTSNELGYGIAPLGPLGDFLESAQRVAGSYMASPGAGRVGQRLLRSGEITLRTIAGNINTSAKLVNGICVGAKWGGNILGAVGVGFTLERLANDPSYHLWGAAGFIPGYGWAISGSYSIGKAIYEKNYKN